jgi:hypothetical protein
MDVLFDIDCQKRLLEYIKLVRNSKVERGMYLDIKDGRLMPGSVARGIVGRIYNKGNWPGFFHTHPGSKGMLELSYMDKFSLLSSASLKLAGVACPGRSVTNILLMAISNILTPEFLVRTADYMYGMEDSSFLDFENSDKFTTIYRIKLGVKDVVLNILSGPKRTANPPHNWANWKKEPYDDWYNRVILPSLH